MGLHRHPVLLGLHWTLENPLNPQLKSLLVGLLTTALGGVAGWLVTKGIITKDQVPQLVEVFVGLAFSGGGALVAYLKSRDHTPANTVLAAKAVPGVTDIKVDTSSTTVASPAVVALAKDPFVPGVNPEPKATP
jgi:hypothetical protein